jgi:relaxase-like protein
MIAKGTTHNNGAKLADYMTMSKEGERAELWQLRGFEATNIKDAFRDVQIMAGATKCEQPFFHVQVRNREGEKLTRQQWERAADRIERMLGLSGQPRAITFHTYQHNDDEHMHVAWSRIDEETLTAKPLPFFKERLKKISRELEIEFGLVPVQNEREGNIKYAPTRAQEEQARRVGVDIHEIRNAIRDCYDRSDCGISFQAALENEGLILAKGDTKGFVVIDPGGGLHALSKRILDVSASKIRDRLSDLVIEQLPTIEAVRALHSEQVSRQIDQYFPAAPADELINQYFGDAVSPVIAKRKEEESVPSWDRDQADIDWQDAVITAAIEKEKIERQFVEPRDRQAAAGSREKEPGQPPTKGAALHIWNARERSDSPQAFAVALDQHGIALAAATQEEADLSHIAAAYPKAIGNFASEYRPGEIVAVTEQGQVYQLNRRTTGKNRNEVETFLASLDRSQLQGIEATKQSQQQRVNEKHWPIQPPQPEPLKTPPIRHFEDVARAATQQEKVGSPLADITGPAASIWTAYNIRIHMQEREREDLLGNVAKYQVPIEVKAGRDPYQFGAALEEKGMALARVTKDEAERIRKEAAHWKTHNEWRPTYREGEFVVITQHGDVYSLNKRTTGHDPKQVQSFLEKAEWKGLLGIEGTKQMMHTRADERAQQRQDVRDQINSDRMDRARATWMRDWSSIRDGKSAKAPRIEAASSLVLGAVAKGLEVATDALESLFAPKLTPQQKHDGEVSRLERQADAEATIDFSRYTADRAQHLLSEQEQQAARDRQRGRERER